MVRLPKNQELIDTLKNFLENNYKSEIETVALSFPDKRSLIVDYELLDKQLPDIAETLLRQPFKVIFNAEEAVKQIDTCKGCLSLHIRFKNLSSLRDELAINKIRSKHLGMLLPVEGFVRKSTTVKSKLQIGAFQCSKCGAVIRIEQEEDILKEPSECYKDQGGCERVSSFKLLTTLSQFIDSQKIEIQEPPESARDGEQPEKIVVYIEDDLVKQVIPGDRVVITGILHSLQKRRGSLCLSLFEKVMDAHYIEIRKTAFENIDISPEDEKLILKTSKDPKLYEKMRKSIAPSIYGYDHIKNAIVLQLVGSDSIILNDGTFRRGDSHFLLMGDPGTAKSILLEAAYKLAIRGIMIEGPSSTGAGLTAAAVKDDFEGGQWTLEAGALVLADKGFAVVDEFDKMDEEDRNKIHRAMEQQKVTISKAGINTTLNTRCSILAAANPKMGNFDVFVTIHEQINLPSTILSRFDGIFAVIDKVDEKKDAATALHIINIRRKPDSIKPVFSSGFIRKYIAFAKQKCHPVISDAVVNVIKDYYVELRKRHTDEPINITPRQLETIIRLSLSSARIRLSDIVEKVDVERAKRVFDSSLNTMERGDFSGGETSDN